MTSVPITSRMISGPEDRPPILLSHCFSGNRHVWDAQLPALSAYRTIRYDTRGHGESDLPPGPYRLDDLGNDVIALLDALGVEQVHYFGMSMGGMIGQNLALRFPHRLASLGLITTTCLSVEADRQDRQDRMAAVRRDGIEGLHDRHMSRWFTAQALRDQLPGVRTMSAAYRSFSPQAFEWISHAILHDLNYADDLRRITMPTLVVASPDDPGVPRDISERMRDEIPAAEFHWLSPAKHLATLEHPERFNRIMVDFLAKHAG
ncbi:alpha/beta fold hydrolase [Candidatus Entotheonella palauensis]|uniref:alpha/beta fold hydrolase n=1 Tax=Candidatus Entotheonella palauensis TaxID=93172 RepID=UPI0011781C45|nr:alpha/beta fold hydrolase [Candidatus Entotheonella palauensis]